MQKYAEIWKVWYGEPRHPQYIEHWGLLPTLHPLSRRRLGNNCGSEFVLVKRPESGLSICLPGKNSDNVIRIT